MVVYPVHGRVNGPCVHTAADAHSLPDDVTSALSLLTFRCHLKTYLFRCCYNTDCILLVLTLAIVVLVVALLLRPLEKYL